MLQYMLWYNTERPHHSLNKKSPLQYFCDIINSNKSEFSQTGMTYTPGGFYDIMKLSRKNKEEIVKFYKNLGFKLEDKGFIQDELDAIACLLTGLMHEKGESLILEGIDGSIILPRIENNLKLKSY
jgi:hypothetical protein